MFERYTESARTVIFFARYEASQFGSPWIETEHLLLGAIREDYRLREQLAPPPRNIESIRKEIESGAKPREKTTISIDLPLSLEGRRALQYAAEEADALRQKWIDTGHLVLGLLRIETCLAADVLRRNGIGIDIYREVVGGSRQPGAQASNRRERPVERFFREWKEPDSETAPEPGSLATALEAMLARGVRRLDTSSEAYGERRLKRLPWSRQEALGHLIDLATVHHQWFARVLTEPKLAASGYPQEDRVAAQQYAHYSWPDLVDLWVGINRLLVHLLTLMPEGKMNTACRIGIEETIPFVELVGRYIRRCDDVVGQILSRLD